VRFLLINNHCINDPTVGVTQSLRTLIQWLADEGHACQVLTTARVESPRVFDVIGYLRAQGVALPDDRRVGAQRARRGGHARPAAPLAHYTIGEIPVTLLLTRHHDEARPDPAEMAQFVDTFETLLQTFAPDQVIACNAHPMILESLARARRRGVTTTFAVRSFGYEDPRYFADVDHVFTCSQFLTDAYRARIGLVSTPIEPPIDWAAVLAPSASRAFATFVHPAPHKGLFLFARLAAMLGERRPDVPILVVQSGHSAGALNAMPGIDFTAWPQIMAAPAVATPAEYLALTRLLLVPSVWEEPFGRVAAEAMINGIPPLVGNRGALPHVVGGDAAGGGGGRVLPIPNWMTHATTRVPTEEEVAPWYDAVCALWDDPELYRSVSEQARGIAETRYSETRSRAAHVHYFTALTPGGRPLRPMSR
jgi:glycosyltransferase involved in cell wall biosynthesis